MNISEILASSMQQPILNEQMPFKTSYACLDNSSNAAYVLTITNGGCDILKVQGLDSPIIGVYEDIIQNVVHVITEANLNVYSYNKRSKQLIRKNNYMFALTILQANPTIITLTEKQQHFRHAARLN